MTQKKRAKIYIEAAEMDCRQLGWTVPEDGRDGYRFICMMLGMEIASLAQELELIKSQLAAEKTRQVFALDESDFDDPPIISNCLEAEPDNDRPPARAAHNISPSQALAKSSAAHPLPFSQLDAIAPVGGASIKSVFITTPKGCR